MDNQIVNMRILPFIRTATIEKYDELTDAEKARYFDRTVSICNKK